MKKELFNRIIAKILEKLPVHKHTIGEGFETYAFKIYDGSEHIELLKSAMKVKDDHNTIALTLRGNPVTTYLTVLYNESKDKISIAHFDAGWAFAGRKNRYYPKVYSKPIVCYSKNLYVFHHKTRKPRLMTTQSMNMWGGLEGEIMKMMADITFEPVLNVPIKYAQNASSDWDIIYNRHGIKIPKALHIFNPDDVLKLVSVLQNPNELTSLCMYVAKPGALLIKDSYFGKEKFDMWASLSQMMVNDPHTGWLIRDFIHDHYKLGRKTTLRITSKKRMEDQHRKMSREIMVQGCKEIKVHEHYKEMFKTFPIEGAELIENKKRLMKESIEQDHCVATYHQYINNGTSCIISVPYQGRQWTLQVNAVAYGNNQYDYRVNQFRGFRNEDAPEELNKLVTAHFESTRIPHNKIVEAYDELPF